MINRKAELTDNDKQEIINFLSDYHLHPTHKRCAFCKYYDGWTGNHRYAYCHFKQKLVKKECLFFDITGFFCSCFKPREWLLNEV